jgi:hypothetical protein
MNTSAKTLRHSTPLTTWTADRRRCNFVLNESPRRYTRRPACEGIDGIGGPSNGRQLLAIGCGQTLVVKPADLLKLLTLRKILTFLPIALLAIAFAQTLPLDLAILFAGDTLMYLEALTILSLLAASGRVRPILHAMRRMSRLVIRAASPRLAKVKRRDRFRRIAHQRTKLAAPARDFRNARRRRRSAPPLFLDCAAA